MTINLVLQILIGVKYYRNRDLKGGFSFKIPQAVCWNMNWLRKALRFHDDRGVQACRRHTVCLTTEAPCLPCLPCLPAGTRGKNKSFLEPAAAEVNQDFKTKKVTKSERLRFRIVFPQPSLVVEN
jgi:hypothetical protein